ncbi:MAG: FHA domain-containing protein [Dehalococcoidia bacterium]|nr:FHA domain-containing protein [Dehalococcoidia bacterium]MDD5494185.1 FHA domain-containing protein [Dehalococcoidia bacterium]
MEQETDAMLIVEKGEPGELGKVIPLKQGSLIIGRSYEEHQPDIPFKNLYISKSHAQITYSDGRYVLIDLPTNKHGTDLNGITMIKGMPYILKHDDEISLAKKSVELRFCFESELGKTLDFPVETVSAGLKLPTKPDIVVDAERMEVIFKGKDLRPRLSKQEFDLLSLLHSNRNRAVSKDKIRDWVWHDVGFPAGITDEAIHSLVYRLKKSLGEYGEHIIAVYGCYRFDEEVRE